MEKSGLFCNTGNSIRNPYIYSNFYVFLPSFIHFKILLFINDMGCEQNYFLPHHQYADPDFHVQMWIAKVGPRCEKGYCNAIRGSCQKFVELGYICKYGTNSIERIHILKDWALIYVFNTLTFTWYYKYGKQYDINSGITLKQLYMFKNRKVNSYFL